MAAHFDDNVEFAIKNIWIDMRSGKKEEALAKLREAANIGDGDAFYFLGRCYLGRSFVDPSIGMPDDKKFAFECFDMSLSLESAVGMFGTMHLEGYTPACGSFVQPPYHTKKEIWDAVKNMADNGQVFCEYLIANAYYYCDVADFLDITPESIGGKQKYKRQIQEWAATAFRMYENCVAKGLGIAIPNLVDLLQSGKNGIPIQRERANKYIHIGADMGIGAYERIVGNEYRNNGQTAKAAAMYESALAHGDNYAYYCLGKLYTFHGAMPLNLKKALAYLETGHAMQPDDSGFCNLLGEIYFYGGQGIEKDFDKAFSLLRQAYRNGSTWGADMLGMCYLKGLGTAVDTKQAQKLFSLHPKRKLAAAGLRELIQKDKKTFVS